MKKNLTIILIIVAVLLLAGGTFFFIKSKKAKDASSDKKPEGVLIETTLAERPYVTLTPSSDGHWLTIEVFRIREADTLEYELLYNTASGATQGSISTVKLEGDSSYSKKILLGSESAGKYKFDEGVTRGTLTIRLRGGPGTRKFVTDFHLQQDEDELASIDNNFSIEGTFSKTNFYLTMMTFGLPGDFDEGEVIAGPYEVFSSGTDIIKEGTVTLKLPEGTETAKLYSWSETEWQEEEAEIEENTLSAKITSLATFIAVKSSLEESEE